MFHLTTTLSIAKLSAPDLRSGSFAGEALRVTSRWRRVRPRGQSAPDQQLPFGFTIPDGLPGAARAPITDREERFFSSSRTPASIVKSRIAIDTFLGWAGVMFAQNPLALYYIDLYCGRGVYADGTPSTPLKLFEKIVAHPRLPNVLQMIFNDRKARFVLELRDHLMAHPRYDIMTSKPQFSHGDVTELRNSGD